MDSNEKKLKDENLISSPEIEAIDDKLEEIVKTQDAITNTIKLTTKVDNQLTANMVPLQLTTPLTGMIEAINKAFVTTILPSFNLMVNSMTKALVSAVTSPFMEWIRNIDLSALLEPLEGLAKFSENYKELNEIYLNAMYECKWFPYAAWISDLDLFTEVLDIISSSRGASKRRESRVDKAIFSYYTDNEIKNIKRRWKNTDLETHTKRILGHAIDAHLRGEYVLTISCLATMWEGLIKAKMTTHGKQFKEDFKQFVGDNGYDEIFSDFYNNLIINHCYSKDEVVEGVPNRHGIAHSWYPKYPNKKASLNAILLTDFIIDLKPKENTEECENG